MPIRVDFKIGRRGYLQIQMHNSPPRISIYGCDWLLININSVLQRCPEIGDPFKIARPDFKIREIGFNETTILLGE